MLFQCRTIRIFLPLILTIFIIGEPVLAQDERLSIRSIRAKKLAAHWQGKIVSLSLTSGETIRGELVHADYYTFSLMNSVRTDDIAIDDIVSVTLKPGFAEGALVLVGAFIGGFFGSAVVSLTVDSPDQVVIGSAAAVGATIGGLFGYHSFFQKIVIHLDE